jgi:hypothetical protein
MKNIALMTLNNTATTCMGYASNFFHLLNTKKMMSVAALKKATLAYAS